MDVTVMIQQSGRPGTCSAARMDLEVLKSILAAGEDRAHDLHENEKIEKNPDGVAYWQERIEAVEALVAAVTSATDREWSSSVPERAWDV